MISRCWPRWSPIRGGRRRTGTGRFGRISRLVVHPHRRPCRRHRAGAPFFLASRSAARRLPGRRPVSLSGPILAPVTWPRRWRRLLACRRGGDRGALDARVRHLAPTPGRDPTAGGLRAQGRARAGAPRPRRRRAASRSRSLRPRICASGCATTPVRGRTELAGMDAAGHGRRSVARPAPVVGPISGRRAAPWSVRSGARPGSGTASGSGR